MFPGAPGARFQYNLDFAADGAGLIWRAAGAPLTFKGLAPGNHQISVRAVGAGGLTGDPAYYSWYGSGPVALLDSAVVSDYPAWRHYCSINSGPEFICRPAGLTLKGLPKGRVAVQIRALAGPGDLAPDQGRRTIIAWDTVGVAPIDPFTLSDSL